jgi:hypothetical protein
MSEMNFFRSPQRSYNPITPHAALKAYEEGILPIEQFIYMSTSVQPLDEKIVDIGAIERILARDDLELRENLFLVEVFESMVMSKDAEHAVFAAESINLIEARYNQKIESSKEQYEKSPDTATASRIAHLYFELGCINGKRKSIKAFYLREAVSYLRIYLNTNFFPREDVSLIVKILLDLDLFDVAKDFLTIIDPEQTDHHIAVFRAEIEFAMHNYDSTIKIVKRFNPDALGESEADLYTYWLSTNEK